MRALSSTNLTIRFAGVLVCASLIALGLAVGIALAGDTTTPSPDSTSSPQVPSTRPAPASGEAQRQLGIIHFVPPTGWQSAEQPDRDAVVFVSPDSAADFQAAIVVLLTKPMGQGLDFRARFEKAVENATDAQPLTERGPVVAGTSRQGCDTLQQTFAYTNAAGRTVRGRLEAARVGDRLAAFWYLATGEDLFKKHADDLLNLLSTVRFDGLPTTAPATGPTTVAATGPTTAPASRPTSKSDINTQLQAIEQEKAELRKRLADLESKEKGLAGTAATRPSPATVPVRHESPPKLQSRKK